MRRYISALSLLPTSLMATETAPALSSPPSMGGQLMSLVFGLVLVIGLIFVLAWLAKRVQKISPNNTQLIKLVASQTLGPRERLVLVQVGDEQVLVGITAGRITPVHVMQKPVTVEQSQTPAPEFAQRLMELLGKDPKGNH